MVGVFDGAQDGFEVGAFDGACDGTKVGAFEGAELGCVVGARVGAMVQIEHAAFPHIDLFLHVQRLAEHFSSAQLQAPLTLPGMPQTAFSSALHPNTAVGAAVGIIVVGFSVGTAVGVPVVATGTHVSAITLSKAEEREPNEAVT